MSDTKPVPAQLEPYEIELEAGKNYAWCACGLSKTQPFCDGSHKPTTIVPNVFKVEKSGSYWMCGCKATGGSPFCDGTHNNL